MSRYPLLLGALVLSLSATVSAQITVHGGTATVTGIRSFQFQTGAIAGTNAVTAAVQLPELQRVSIATTVDPFPLGTGGAAQYWGVTDTQGNMPALSSRLDDAVKKSREQGKPMVWLVEAPGPKNQQVTQWTKELRTLSSDVPVLYASARQAAAFIPLPTTFRSGWTVMITDSYSNPLWWQMGPLNSPLQQQVVTQAKAYADVVTAFDGWLKQRVQTAENESVAGKPRQAILALGAVLSYRGYPAVDQAQALLEKLVAEGKGAVMDASAQAAQDDKQARARLEQLATQYAGTEVAELARQSLAATARAARNPAAAPATQPAAGGV